eukprot:TRINITY_DN1218_c0_g1_i1.p1 TRINITY_DN1218_c0_g1~~TRINITY_DN1218_c0_g1_i1.p1  ORF type:complete len:272 (+),score=47.49 TRINITY_DN1218_c0_g1_i1:60-875(+)
MEGAAFCSRFPQVFLFSLNLCNRWMMYCAHDHLLEHLDKLASPSSSSVSPSNIFPVVSPPKVGHFFNLAFAFAQKSPMFVPLVRTYEEYGYFLMFVEERYDMGARQLALAEQFVHTVAMKYPPEFGVNLDRDGCKMSGIRIRVVQEQYEKYKKLPWQDLWWSHVPFYPGCVVRVQCGDQSIEAAYVFSQPTMPCIYFADLGPRHGCKWIPLGYNLSDPAGWQSISESRFLDYGRYRSMRMLPCLRVLQQGLKHGRFTIQQLIENIKFYSAA